ncbi:hypothetical protein SESBI_26415 [Sesbania bispinosa]|nr:hypothetical protein SESBI_26415 [Sesbania bispinosa]
MKEAAMKPLPNEKPYKKIKAVFYNLDEKYLEDLEEPIIVPIKMVEPSTTSKEINQPVADDKVEEITPSVEPAEKIVDEVAPTDHNKDEPTESDTAPCAENKDIPTVINLEEPVVVFNEESSVDKVGAAVVMEEN